MWIAALVLIAAAEGQAPRPAPVLGYPVSADADGDDCLFLIQDMYLRDAAMVERWMSSLPDKTRQIDVVWPGGEQNGRCIVPARSAVERAGFGNIVVRVGSPDEYPDRLRPPGGEDR